MPEYPDIVVYMEALETRISGRVLKRVRISHPFLLRTAEPPITAFCPGSSKRIGHERSMH
ncbi:MAG: hypothetical protein KAJ17_01535 [Candidatus Krumholzibacteria bacterium]|nr:hypothetical protein [Candidatus Krumholzibacteria bacterium]